MNHSKEILDKFSGLEKRISELEKAESFSITDPTMALAISSNMIINFPALRGFWPGSVMFSTGTGSTGTEIADISGNGKRLAGTGAPKFDFDLTRFFPSVKFDGSTEYASSVDAAHWDIPGVESGVVNAIDGLTIFAWVYFDNTASDFEYILSKRSINEDDSYYLARNDSGKAIFGITPDGSTDEIKVSIATIASGGWHLIGGRFTPSTEVATFLDGIWALNTTSISASIHLGNKNLYMAARDGTDVEGIPQKFLTGNISLAFITASAIPDGTLENYYQASRNIFGV